jgi:Beta-ketoacyl synthase, N-terminal domain
MLMDRQVGIVAYDCLSPLGTTFGATWKELVNERSGIAFIDRYDPGKETLSGVSSIAYAGQVPLTYAEMAGSPEGWRRSPEPSSHCVRTVCQRVLEDLDFDLSRHDPQRIAVFGATALTAQISQHVLETTSRPYASFILNQCRA